MSAPWRLRVERGPNAGQSFPIDRASATIGRQENNAIVLDDARLSRQHARIESGPLGLTVTDLNSANGTLVNGRPLTRSVPLNAGDRLQLGDTIMVVEGVAASLGGGQDATVIGGAAGGGGFAPASAPAPVAPRLVVQGTGKVFQLDRPAMVIGRQPENDLPLEDTQASRQHARFETRDGQVTVTDLGSANGTRVNGIRISAPTQVNNGDLIQIGTSQLRVEGIAFVDHGTAAALGFFPPPPSGPALGAAPALGGPAPLGGSPFGSPPDEGATVIGGPPPMLAGGPPQGAPGQPWNTPLAPQFGGAPPPIQPPMPPAAPAQRRRGPLPLILIGLAAIVVLLCIAGGVGAFVLSRGDDADPTATPAAAAGTPVPAASTPLPIAGTSGGNTAPPPPGASAAPSAAPSAVPSASARPSAAPSAAAVQPTPTAPRASARPSASTSAGNRKVLSVESVGLRLAIPADWQEISSEEGRVSYGSPDGRAQIIVRWSTQAPSNVTARSLIQQELADTAATDSTFDAAAVGTGNVTVGGQPGYGSEIYTFTSQSGTRVSEADRAVVLSGQAQYFFSFLALEQAFQTYAATFDEIIDSIQITGP